jgi:CheY-like chemotaxis protein
MSFEQSSLFDSIYKNNGNNGKPTTPKGILVVEDECNMREMLCKIVFEKLGNWAVGAPDGSYALDFLHYNYQHIGGVICDLSMPKIDGMELIRLIRINDRMKHIKFAIISNHDDFDLRSRAEMLGVERYISKSKSGPNEYISELKRAFEQLV